MIERHIVANFGCLTDDAAHAVIDEQAAADLRRRMYLDAGDDASRVGNHPPDEEEPGVPRRVRNPVEEKSMKTRIAEEHFETRARRRIPVHDHAHVFADPLQPSHRHGSSLWITALKCPCARLSST